MSSMSFRPCSKAVLRALTSSVELDTAGYLSPCVAYGKFYKTGYIASSQLGIKSSAFSKLVLDESNSDVFIVDELDIKVEVNATSATIFIRGNAVVTISNPKEGLFMSRLNNNDRNLRKFPSIPLAIKHHIKNIGVPYGV